MPVTGSSNTLYTSKCTLVPARFFDPSVARAVLADVVEVSDDDQIRHIEVPCYEAVMVYACSGNEKREAVPELYRMLRWCEAAPDNDKIVISYVEGMLFVVLAGGNKLLLCNSFEAQDFTTAEYFLFTAMKRFHINPEVSTLYCRTSLTSDQELSLCRYFRSVEII